MPMLARFALCLALFSTDEVWLPQHINLKIDAKFALLKQFNMDLDIGYRDYKKFRTETKIIPGGEVVEKR